MTTHSQAEPVYTLLIRDEEGKLVAIRPLSDRPVLIGRAEECDIVLPSTGVSRQHAAVSFSAAGVVQIADAGSANGVFVDGQYIREPVTIDETSRISIGDFRLVIEISGAAKQPDDRELVEPVASFTADTETVHEPLFEQLQLIGRGPYDGTAFTLTKAVVTVGRAPTNDWVLDDPSISPQHAQLRLLPAGTSFELIDLRSANGSFVDDQQISRAQCREGSVVRLGALAFEVMLERRRAQVLGPQKGRRWLGLAALTVCVAASLVGLLIYLERPEPALEERGLPAERQPSLPAKLPASSRDHREARDKREEIDERLAVEYRAEGVRRCRAKDWKQCQRALCTFFENVPEKVFVPDESHLREILQQAEERLARQRGFSPCRAPRFLK